MPTIHLLGRIFPAVVDISMDSIPQPDWVVQEINVHMHFKINVLHSHVDVQIDTNTYRDEDFGYYYNRAYDLVRGCVDTVAFATGHGLTVILETLMKPDGSLSPILITNPALVPYCTFLHFPIVTPDDRALFEKALTIVLSEPPIFMALNDLIQANTVPHYGTTNCARVLDGLRKIIVPDVDPKPAWPIFRATMNVDEAYTTYISEHSKNTRHGGRDHIPGTVVTEVTKRTWILMNRFMEYRMRGNQPLPLADFPLLIG